MPRRDGTTSVLRIDGLSHHAVQTLGTALLKEHIPIAHAVSSASTVIDLGLRFDPDNTPERHANIVDWPLTKPEQKLIALKIAAMATVIRYS